MLCSAACVNAPDSVNMLIIRSQKAGYWKQMYGNHTSQSINVYSQTAQQQILQTSAHQLESWTGMGIMEIPQNLQESHGDGS